MRKLTSLIVVALLAVPMAACDEQPTELSQDTQLESNQEVRASHGQSSTVEASAVYRAVGTEAAELNDFQRGERVGTLHVTDDGSSLTVEGEASGLDPDGGPYVSLFYDKQASAQGSPESENAAQNAGACEPGEDQDHPLSLSVPQMVIGPGSSPGPLAWWDVEADGSAELGPTSTLAYVPVKKIGTVSIRDTRVNNGFGADAVVACGVVTHDPAN